MGLWQEYDVSTSNSANLDLKKVFVLGTTGVGVAPQITLARYSTNGTLDKTVKWPGLTVGTPSVREAKAMTIPVVAAGTAIDDTPRIYVAATIDGSAGTTDIAVLAYSFDLKLMWMATYNYAPIVSTSDWAEDDEAVAITTDQSIDLANDSLDYSVIAVLGSSIGVSTGKDWVTLAYNRDDGCQIMVAQRYTSAGNATDTPVDIACGRGAALDSNGAPHTAIFVTGASPNGSTGNGEYYTTAYLILGNTCPFSTGNGVVAASWPRKYSPSGFISTPARMKWLKNMLFITGTTQAITGGGSDMLTIAYDSLGTTSTAPIVHQMDFTDQGTTDSRVDSASDLEIFHIAGGSELVAITGSSTGTDPSGTGIATQLYDFALNPLWKTTTGTPVGAIWTRNPSGSGNDDEGVRLQMIDSDYDEAESGSLANLYVTGRSHTSAGYQYVTLKYGTAADATLTGFKATSWTAANIPNTFYSNAGTGDHIPARIVVQRVRPIPSTLPRLIFVTGTSLDATSADDWATMFTGEQ